MRVLVKTVLLTLALTFSGMLLFVPLSASAANTVMCHYTWEANGQIKRFHKAGKTEADALKKARDECKTGAVQPWSTVCTLPPKDSSCGPVGGGECIGAANLYTLGMGSHGHKTNYCRAQGFDSYDNKGTCLRTCPGVCTKVSIKSLGWEHGNKHEFCVAQGYESVKNFGVYKNGGYCYSRPEGVSVEQCTN